VITMAMIGKIRWMRPREGKSVREIVRLTSLARNTVRTVFAPAGYQPVEAAARAAAARHHPTLSAFCTNFRQVRRISTRFGHKPLI